MKNTMFVALATASLASGQLGLDLGFPQIAYDNLGVTQYQASDGLLSIDADPLAIRFEDGGFPSTIVADSSGSKLVSMRAFVDEVGMFEMGVAGADLVVRGAIDQDGDGTADFDGVLLVAEVVEIGFASFGHDGQGSGGGINDLSDSVRGHGAIRHLTGAGQGSGPRTIEFEVRADVSGGLLADLYAGRDLGMTVLVENSTFTSFRSDWLGGAKGTIGPDGDPLGACCLSDGACVLVTEADCDAMGGAYSGDGTDCDSIDEYLHINTDDTGSTDAGRIVELVTSWNPSTEVFSFEMTLEENNGHLANAFHTVVNDGPEPGRGEAAIFYFDATDPDDPILSVFAYNGRGGSEGDVSFEDGDGFGGPADVILCSLNDDDFVRTMTAIDNADGTRTLGFSVNAGAILDHDPAYPGGNPWYGVGFDAGIGYWTHAVVVDGTDYDASGCLSEYDIDRRNSLDRSHLEAGYFGCIPFRSSLLRWSFNELGGDVIFGQETDIDLQVHEDDGTCFWAVDPQFGSGMEFVQDRDGRTRAASIDGSRVAALADHLDQDDQVTVQVAFRQDDGNQSGARILTWSDGTAIADRNFSIIGRPAGNGMFDYKVRLRTTDNGVTELTVDDAWAAGETVVATFTFSSDTEALVAYVNGVEAGRIDDIPGGFLDWDRSMPMLIANETTLNRAFSGAIYDIRIWDEELDASDVMQEALRALRGN